MLFICLYNIYNIRCFRSSVHNTTPLPFCGPVLWAFFTGSCLSYGLWWYNHSVTLGGRIPCMISPTAGVHSPLCGRLDIGNLTIIPPTLRVSNRLPLHAPRLLVLGRIRLDLRGPEWAELGLESYAWTSPRGERSRTDNRP